MSQHIYTTTDSARPLLITLGYDRPLDYVFMTVEVVTDGLEDYFLYCNLDDPNAGTECTDVNYYRRKLLQLDIVVPDSMFSAVMQDQRDGIGNRVVLYNTDQT